jgi:hypothetical protein
MEWIGKQELEVNTSFFDAVLELPSPLGEKALEVIVHIKGQKIQGTIYPYDTAPDPDDKQLYVCVHLFQPILVNWRDRFDARGWKGVDFRAEGRVLNPFLKKDRPGDLKRKLEFLESLLGSEKEMLLAKAQEG